MSETDDTDVLVLVPPDFFAVETSDSDESLGTPFYNSRGFANEHRQGVEREAVNTLFHQVNSLENRLSLIENRDIIETGLSDHRNFYSSQTSIDDTKLAAPGLFQSTPHKSRQLTSLPCTPSNVNFDHHPKSHSLPRRKPKSYTSYNSAVDLDSSFKPLSKSAMSFQENLGQRGDRYPKPNNVTPGKENGLDHSASGDGRTVTQPRYNAELMDEIDQFLDNVAKTPQSKRCTNQCSKHDCLYKCGEKSGSVPDLNYGLRDFDSLPIREEPVNVKHFAQLEPQTQPGEPKRLNLPEVEKLLKEMETTQNIIEYKLRQKEAQFGKNVRDNTAFPHRSLQCGDSVGSMPDLGFGIRDLMAGSKTDEKRTPVHEDKVIKRSMSLCGVNPSEQASNGKNKSSSKPYSEENVRRDFTPRRLELGSDPGSIPDLGFGLVEWYRNNPDGNVQSDTRPQNTREYPTAPGASYLEGGNASSIPDLGFGLRDLWSNEGTSTSRSNPGDLLSQGLGKLSTNSESNPSVKSSTAEPSSTTLEIPCTKKVGFSTESGFKDTRTINQEHGSKPNNFLSLSELWSSSGASKTPRDPSDLKQRLEEEKYRREHCERLIQQLQSRLLEEQQKLAVAVQVDTAKDHVIQHFQGAWTQLVSHWNELEEERHDLATQLQKDREQYQKNVNDTLQRLKRYELELSQSLDIAQSYKEKLEIFERERNEYAKSETQKFQSKLQEREQAVIKANQEKNKLHSEKGELLKRVNVLEEESKKDKAALLNMKRDLDKRAKVINGYEADTSALKEEKENLQMMLREEKSRNSLLDQQKKNYLAALEESKKREKHLQEEVKSTAVSADKLKKELRDFYQEQVEIVVRDKLQEFQGQLDSAEKSLRIELENREQAITSIATKQISQISEKHQLEVKLLEEKQKEELQLYQLKLAQATSHIHKLQNKLKSYNSRKGEIVEQLHGVMETQWQHALRIINGNSPKQVQARSSKAQINGQDTSCASSTVDNNSGRDLTSFSIPPLNISQLSSRPSTSETPFGKEGQVTYRSTQGDDKGKGQKIENDLKKYIEMLLNRSPGNAVLDDTQWQVNPENSNGQIERRENPKIFAVNDDTKQFQWERVAIPQNGHQDGHSSLPDYDTSRISQNSASKDTRLGKPPWK